MKRKNMYSIGMIALVIVLFIGAFQIYIMFEKKSYKAANELMPDSSSVVEVSLEDEEETYYVNDEDAIFNDLVQGLDSATFKPTKQTPKGSEYVIRVYNESLEVETILSVFPNRQIQVNDQMYRVEDANLTAFEDNLFQEKYEVTFKDFEGFSTYMYEQVAQTGIYAQKNEEWAETIALARVAQEKEVDLSNIDLLLIAPTKEVAKQLITFGMTGADEYQYLLEAVKKERTEVAEVLLENEVGIEVDPTFTFGTPAVVIAKLNEDQEMVDLLLRYGFEDEFVDPEHVKQAQKYVDFSDQDPERVKKDLKKGQLPGVDFQIPTSTKKIVESWGDYTKDEEETFLNYNRHSFFQMSDMYNENGDSDDQNVFGYLYQFQTDASPDVGDVKNILGEPDDMFIEEDVSEFHYTIGSYRLNMIIDADGKVFSLSYFYE